MYPTLLNTTDYAWDEPLSGFVLLYSVVLSGKLSIGSKKLPASISCLGLEAKYLNKLNRITGSTGN